MMNWNRIIEFAKKGGLAPGQSIQKSEQEWRTQLTPEQFRVTRQQVPSARFRVNTVRVMIRECMDVSVVGHHFLIAPKNLKVEPVGLVLLNPLMIIQSNI